jgi:hypothetical protein
LRQIDFSLLVRVLSAAKLSDLAVALTGYLISQVVSCGRWALLTRPLGFVLPFQITCRFTLSACFQPFAPARWVAMPAGCFISRKEENLTKRNGQGGQLPPQSRCWPTGLWVWLS